MNRLVKTLAGEALRLRLGQKSEGLLHGLRRLQCAYYSSWADFPPDYPSTGVVPVVVESSSRGDRIWDLYSKLLKERIVCLNGPIQQHTSDSLVAQLLFLESADPYKPINMYINSPGGIISAGLAIYDTMQYIGCPVYTIAVGQASSMASLLLASGEPQHRRALPHTRIMLHQPSGGARGQAADIEIQANEILKMRSVLNNLYVKHTGQELEKIESKLDRDTFFSAEEAKDFGLIDEVLVHRVKSEEEEIAALQNVIVYDK